jgi:hypothetical protein
MQLHPFLITYNLLTLHTNICKRFIDNKVIKFYSVVKFPECPGTKTLKKVIDMSKVDKLLNDLLKANRATNKKVIKDFNNQNERLIKLLAEVNNAKF